MFKFISNIIFILILYLIILNPIGSSSISNSSEYKDNIKSKDPYTRKHYIEKLAVKPIITDEDILILVDALNDKSDIVWLSAVRTIKKIYPQGQQILSYLIKILNDKKQKPEKKYYIIQILNLYKDKSYIFIDDLLKILKENKTPTLIKIQIIDLFSKLTYKSNHIISNLHEIANNSEDELLRFKAWKSLSMLEPNNDEAIAKLVAVAQSKSTEKIRSNAGVINTSYYPTLDAVTTLVDFQK